MTPPVHMEKARNTYGFTTEAKEWLRRRTQTCQFPPGCEGVPTHRISHLSGVASSQRLRKDPSPITDIGQNAFDLCPKHEFMLDQEEREFLERVQRGESILPYAVEVTIYEA